MSVYAGDVFRDNYWLIVQTARRPLFVLYALITPGVDIDCTL